jgi:hypothetical protein
MSASKRALSDDYVLYCLQTKRLWKRNQASTSYLDLATKNMLIVATESSFDPPVSFVYLFWHDVRYLVFE